MTWNWLHVCTWGSKLFHYQKVLTNLDQIMNFELKHTLSIWTFFINISFLIWMKIRGHIIARINNALYEDATNFNEERQDNSFFKMSLRFTGSHGPDYILPLLSKEEMELKIQCQKCNAHLLL